MANNPLTNVWQSLIGAGSMSANPQAAAQQTAISTWASSATSISPIYTSPSYASTISYNMTQWSAPSLDAESAANLITQCDEDHTLLDGKGRLKFGRYRGRRLCKADLEYVVALGRAINKLRQAINKDIRARRALARLTQ